MAMVIILVQVQVQVQVLVLVAVVEVDIAPNLQVLGIGPVLLFKAIHCSQNGHS